MIIERELIPVVDLADFADRHGLVMQVTERSRPTSEPFRFCAHFKRAEVMSGGMLNGTYGDGRTEAEAIANYAQKISCTRLAIGAYSEDRRELTVPRLTFTPVRDSHE